MIRAFLFICLVSLNAFASKDSIGDNDAASASNPILKKIHFAVVEPGHLYRGGRPQRFGMEELKKIGVRTVIGLQGGDVVDHTPLHWVLEAASPGERLSRINQEKQDAHDLGLKFVWEPLAAVIFYTSKITWNEDDTILDALREMDDPSNYPIYIHCTKGRDRSGLIIALWRVKHGWSIEKAHDEWKASGHRGLNFIITHTLDKYFYVKARMLQEAQRRGVI